jgi:predicted dinucleotide-binding enzyme
MVAVQTTLGASSGICNRKEAGSATAIVGVGNIGSALARNLVRGDESAGSVVAALLPAGAHYVKAFGADALAAGAYRQPRRAVLFYATDDDAAATTIERLIRAVGFDPLKAGGIAAAGQIEAPGGDLHQFGLNGELVDLEQGYDVGRVEQNPLPDHRRSLLDGPRRSATRSNAP